MRAYIVAILRILILLFTEEKEQQSVAKKIENVLKSELVKEENGSKTIKFFANYELYFKFSKGPNGKGMIVEEAIDAKFGEYGIGKGWKLSKLGRRNVIKSSFIMLKNQLMAQASTAKVKGYELTFIDDAFKENSASTPNSPNVSSNDVKQNKIPKTLPLKPVIAPNTNEQNIKLSDDDKKVEIVSNELDKNDTKKNEDDKVTKSEIVSNEEPKLKQARDPFATMSEINIADKQQKEDNEQRNKMKLERKNSMPTNPNKPSFRPKIDKQQIKKYKPPSTQTTTKESEESMPTFTVFTNEKKEENVNKNSKKKEEKIKNKMAIKSNNVKKEKEKRKEAIVSNPHHRKTSSFKIRPKQKKNKELATNSKPKIVIKPKEKIKSKTKALPSNPIKPLAKNENESIVKKQMSPIPSSSSPFSAKIATAESPKNTKPAIPALTEASKISTTNKGNSTNNMTPKKVQNSEEQKEEKKFKKKRKSSYEAPKSCELMENVSDSVKEIKLFQEFTKFFSAKPCDGNKGFMVDELTANEFGEALKDLGIANGWKVTECAGKKLGNKMFAMLKNQISAVSTKSDDGYCVVFEDSNKSNIISLNSTAENKEEKVSSPISPKRPKSPRSPKVSVEVIESTDSQMVVLRLYHNMDKYISGSAQKGPKGYKIEEFHKMFGDELKNAGIEIGWKLIKIGDKSVENAFYQMIKNNLSVEFKNSQNKGYLVTFAAA